MYVASDVKIDLRTSRGTGYAYTLIMPKKTVTAPHIEQDAQDRGQIHLSGSWVLANLLTASELLQSYSNSIQHINARNIDQLDSAGALQLLRFTTRTGLKTKQSNFGKNTAP